MASSRLANALLDSLPKREVEEALSHANRVIAARRDWSASRSSADEREAITRVTTRVVARVIAEEHRLLREEDVARGRLSRHIDARTGESVTVPMSSDSDGPIYTDRRYTEQRATTDCPDLLVRHRESAVAQSAQDAARTAIEVRDSAWRRDTGPVCGPAKSCLPRMTPDEQELCRPTLGQHREMRTPVLTLSQSGRIGDESVVCEKGRLTVRPKSRRSTRGKGRKVRR